MVPRPRSGLGLNELLGRSLLAALELCEEGLVSETNDDWHSDQGYENHVVAEVSVTRHDGVTTISAADLIRRELARLPEQQDYATQAMIRKIRAGKLMLRFILSAA